MVMLREWNAGSYELIVEMMARFGVEVDADSIILRKYEALSPDCFIWFFTAGKNHSQYCLYAEDHVPSLQYVHDMIQEHMLKFSFGAKYEFLPVVYRQQWGEASPVVAASVYNGPEDTSEFMKFAATSGYDFVFLTQAFAADHPHYNTEIK